MDIRLSDHFDPTTLQRGRDYERRGLVVSVERSADGALTGTVSNGNGKSYQQQITMGRSLVDGICSCPVGYNCKHVAAVLLVWGDHGQQHPGLAAPVQSWLGRVRKTPFSAQAPEQRPEGYPDNVKDRLLYVLVPQGTQVKIEIYKGQVSSAGTGLNKSIRRYDALHAMRSAAPARFIRPVDMELLSALVQARLWDASYSYGLPDLLRPKGEEALSLIRRICQTGRFLHDNTHDAYLSWSDARPTPRLTWRMAADGNQRLGFADASGQPLELQGLDGASIWIDTQTGRIGALEGVLAEHVLQLVKAGPEVAPHEVEAVSAALPDMLAGLDLPRPHTIRQARRAARKRVARLILGRESARDGPRYWGTAVQLPTLTLRFVYDGQEVREGDADPRLVTDGEIVTLTRDHGWEATCAMRLMESGALPVEELEGSLAGRANDGV